ncbi:flagellar export chaperone FliS [Sulfuriflexus sp.]|uniref:flagellar export chaperone FliS n=1 Tax=Sulfuriflexus sp. TaxID=2015443 RepID=UPI0028CBFB12|nr:flagellar export chaperone FliS [Sulfuriflexus sp.]MDT8404478.1 flagellar export chaperone FliS [Sulfuriflexus sp.]
MNMAAMQSALDQYKKVGVQSGIESASPHRLIQMLMEGVLEKVSSAKGFMTRGEVGKKGESISWAISILDGLRVSLDRSIDAELVHNLDALYDYMSHRLLEANLNNDTAILDEVTGLMRDVKAGWDGIAQEVVQIEEAKSKVAQKGA